jgi:hypothetical protein
MARQAHQRTGVTAMTIMMTFAFLAVLAVGTLPVSFGPLALFHR